MANLEDVQRDALALVSAMARSDKEACDVILGSADHEPLAAILAGMVVGALQLAGVDPEQHMAEIQRLYVHGGG
jgi:hypothetical protein